MTTTKTCLTAVAVALSGVTGLSLYAVTPDPTAGVNNPPSNTVDQTGNAVNHAADNTADNSVNAANRTSNALGNATDTHVVRQIQRTLSRAVNDALIKGDFDDFVGYLSKASRDKIGKVEDDSTLDAKIDQFQNDWKAKYGEYFYLSAYHDILSNTQVQTQGNDRATVMLSDAAAANAAAMNGKNFESSNKPDTGVNNPANNPANNGTPNAANMNNGGTGQGQSATLNLVNEGSVMNAWRIDAPQIQSADQARQAISQVIDKVEGMKDAWPQDKTQAYRTVAVNLLKAFGSESNAAPTAINR